MWLGSHVAVVVVQSDSCSSGLNPSPGISICTGAIIKRRKKKTWVELETLILSEVSEKEKNKYHMIPLIF